MRDYTDRPVPKVVIDHGACRGMDPQLFFPGPRLGRRKSPVALAACHECPVLRECREYALSLPWIKGIWGGMTEKDRWVPPERKAV